MENRSGFDVNVTMGWVRGVLSDPERTAQAYQETQPPWQRTFIQITLPVYVASAVVGYVLSLLFGGAYTFGAAAGTPFFFLISLIWSIAYVFVVVFIFDFFAGVFNGKRNYDAAFAALSLAMVPAMVGSMLSPLPWLGWLISLVALIYALVLLYRFIPVFMTVPEDKRTVHYIVSLVVAFLVNLVVAGMLAAAFGPDLADYLDDAERGSGQVSDGGGVFGGFQRQADFADQAARDTYDPPEDGRLTEEQVATYARTLERTSELRDRLGKRFENMEEEEGPSLGDIFSGVQDAARLGTAEMEVVKTAGGNWAEHQWVKNQIETARVQRDSSPAVVDNYELFVEYQDRIEPYE